MKRLLSSSILALALMVVPISGALAEDFAEVTVTATPSYLALTNTEASWPVGAVEVSSTYWWTTDGNAPDPEPFEAADMKSTIENTGTVAQNIGIKVAAFTGGGGWTISTDDTPIEPEISIRAGITGTANEAAMVQVITTNTELKGNLASAGTIKWCMEMETPSSFADGDERTGIVTLSATAA